jgi:hypothetical protein
MDRIVVLSMSTKFPLFIIASGYFSTSRNFAKRCEKDY